MKFNELIKYLNSSLEDESFDPLWNQVILFQKFSADLSNLDVLKGMPFHSDYSKYQRRVVKNEASNPLVNISYSNSQPIPSQPGVTSYFNLNNRLLRNQRISEINSQSISTQFSETRACYLSVQPGQTKNFDLGTSDFTVDITFKVDEITPVALGGSIQCLFSVGFNVAQSISPITNILTTAFSTSANGYGLYIRENNLLFVCKNNLFQLNEEPLVANTWYSFSFQRKDNVLQSFLNGTLQREYPFNLSVDSPVASNRQAVNAIQEVDTFLKQMHIGSDPVLRTTNFFNYVENTVDTCFSGSISNFRITETARYLNSNFTNRLPYYNALRENSLDSFYSQTIFNTPFTFDLFDYSKNATHFSNREFLYGTSVNLRTGGYILDGSGPQVTNVIPETLNSSEWTVEFFVVPSINKNTDIPYYRQTGLFSGITFNNIGQFLEAYSVYQSYQQPILDLKYPLFSITDEEDKPVLEVLSNIHYLASPFSNSASHRLSLKLSNDGSNFFTFSSEADIDLANPGRIGYIPTPAPTNEIAFLFSSTSNLEYIPEELPSYTGFLRGEHEKVLHVAIQKYLNNLYFFVNGELYKTVFFNGSLHSGNGLKVKFNDNFEDIVGTLDGQIARLQLGVKGFRITNAARYNISTINNVWDLNNTQPFRTAADKITPPRARIVDIVRKSLSEIVSLDEVEWYVFLSVPVDNLTTNSFTLTQIEGISNASIVGIEKVTEYEYIVKANTGEGNGRLTLNFIDDNTVTYKNTALPIGNFLGELDFEGETYRVNKSAPQPILSSGSSPYINGSFRVEIKFDSALAVFDPSKIGIVNGTISNIKIIDEILKIYDFLVTPIKEDPVIIQALPGAGVTDNGLLSLASEPLVRIFSRSFPILQLPLNIPSFTNDLSPSRLVLNQTVPNSLVHSTSVAPVGAGSSMHVVPFQEQSGLNYPNFRAIDTSFNTYNSSNWTIEWFYRGNTTGGKTTHLFTVQNQATGFSVLMQNGKLRIQRSMEAPNNLFPTLNVDERATNTFVQWDNPSFTNLEKYPHFAISKQGNVYRFYVNGVRRAIIQSDININITTGNLFVGYYPNRVDDEPYFMSNIRFTYGRALYTSATVAVPFVPYPVLPDITQEVNLLNYISIYSNNSISNLARTNDKIILYFSSIARLSGTPEVFINGIVADVVEEPYNSYKASITVDDSIADGQATFLINIPAQPGIPATSFSSTTNNTFVVVDNQAISALFTTENFNDSRPVIDVLVNFSEEPLNISKNSFTLSNAYITDFYLDARNRFCTFKLNAITSGTASVQLLENSFTDLAGNGNVASSVFARNVIVPTIFPDINFNNVICLIQPQNNTIQDLSSNNSIVTVNNVAVSTDESPAGLSRSMYFNGLNSSLDIDLKQSIAGNTPYTIELFAYMPTGTLFKLTRPTTLPATEVTSRSFTANWTEVEEASKYVVDVSPNPTFNNYLPGYQHRETSSNEISVGESLFKASTPTALFSNYVGSDGFIARWNSTERLEAPLFVEGYNLQVSLTSDFTDILEAYSNSLIEERSKLVGKVEALKYREVPQENIDDNDDVSVFNNNQGVLLTSLFSNNNYPKLFYTLEESTIRYYPTDGYTLPAIAEDIDLFRWNHIAIVNNGRYSYLYVNGELHDKTEAASYNNEVSSGYSIGGFTGYITSLRITKGIPRYTDRSYTVPNLPLYHE